MKFNSRITSSIAGASVILSLMGILSKGVGFIREIIYANNFGLSSEYDLFLTSTALPIVLNTAVIYLCQHYFIPVYNKTKIKSDLDSLNFFNYTFWWFVLIGVVISVLLFIASTFIFDFYLASISPELKRKGLQIFLLLLITVPINAGTAVITAYLQANFNFIYPAVSQIFLNIIIIILIILFTDIFQIFILPLSFVAAYLVSFILLYYPVKDRLKFVSGHILKLRYKLSDINILISLIFIEGLSLSYILIDRYFIGRVPEGGIAALNYALVIYSLPVTIISIPLITTMFSKFSKSSLISPEILRTDFASALRLNIFIILPFTFFLFFWGKFFLQLFYERGEFSTEDTFLTHKALQYYTLGLIFYSTYLIAVKLLYSINKYNHILVISIIAFLLKIFFNFLMIDNLKQNGLALSTSFIYIFLFFSGLYLAIKEIQIENKFLPINTLIYFGVNGIISFVISYYFVLLFRMNGILFDTIQILIFIFIYGLNSYLLKDKEFKIIKDTIYNILLWQKD